ncbi:MAG: ribosome biogenesis GTPase Der [Capsulimonadaceae bacterium]|nr:ribosome biogenesis GTPase Der [Capsulimonadaceae bacterium]
METGDNNILNKPLVAIVGRPNVGKSTLFNRLVGRRIAIVEDTPGITRDRLYADGEWNGREYTLIDTGGIQMGETDPLRAMIRAQAEIAMSEADVIIFVVDGREGITASDEELADELRRSPKPVVVCVNKTDNQDQENKNVADFYALGFEEIFGIAALGGRSVADALDAIVGHFPPRAPSEPEDDDRIKIAIIGRPNVGKSSLLNAIIGQERAIVSPVAGTTRDAIDTVFTFNEHEIVLIDTAGIRRAGKIQGSVEYYTVLRALRAIERADVVLLVVDSVDGITDGDKRVGGYAHDAGRAAVVVVNKWDIGRDDVLEGMPGKNPMQVFTEELRDALPFMAYAPVAFTSALTGKGVSAVVETAIDAANAHSMRIATGELNRLLRDAIDAHPYSEKGRSLKVYYATMTEVKPPHIVLFVNDPELVHFSYRRYLENQIRKTYAFEGTPIKIDIKRADKRVSAT